MQPMGGKSQALLPAAPGPAFLEPWRGLGLAFWASLGSCVSRKRSRDALAGFPHEAQEVVSEGEQCPAEKVTGFLGSWAREGRGD